MSKMGPFERFYDAMTAGQGLLGVRGVKKERELTDRLIERVQANRDLEGLYGMAEAGRAAMTVEGHANFRANLIQESVNQDTFTQALELFTNAQSGLRQKVVTPGDTERLDLLDAQGLMAGKLLRSVDPAVRQQGASIMSSIMADQRSYAQQNETQRLELEAAEESGRASLRQEFQSEINNRFVGPMLEDRAQYESIKAQLADGQADATAAPALISMVLDYAGAALRQSDDGNWGFSFGGLSLGDKAVPDMTYSQLRNQLEAAHGGRDKYMSTALSDYGKSIEGQRFGIDGNLRVNDLVFPLASETYKGPELQYAPKPSSSDANADKIESAASSVADTAVKLGRRTGLTGALANGIESVAGFFKPVSPAPAPAEAAPPEPGFERDGTTGGVYVPRRLRRLFRRKVNE